MFVLTNTKAKLVNTIRNTEADFLRNRKKCISIINCFYQITLVNCYNLFVIRVHCYSEAELWHLLKTLYLHINLCNNLYTHSSLSPSLFFIFSPFLFHLPLPFYYFSPLFHLPLPFIIFPFSFAFLSLSSSLFHLPLPFYYPLTKVWLVLRFV